jgi:hypothetical protein
MNYIDVLKLYNGTIWGSRIKVARHAHPGYDLELLVTLGMFEDYQARQAKDVFNCDYVVSLLGEHGSRSRFIGMYQLLSVRDGVPPWPVRYPYPKMNPGRVWYDLKRLADFEDLEDRLVVDWGAGMRSWLQWLKPKEVIEILPRGHTREFPGYDNVVLPFPDLERIVQNPDANRTWHSMLSAVAGVYLITDTVSGDQYVGSASGAQGILGRWVGYAKTKHGGNKRLKRLLDEHPDRHVYFSFSILRTLPRSMTAREVVEVENIYKRKLGSRAFGLNDN